jgi:hypothetical protein
MKLVILKSCQFFSKGIIMTIKVKEARVLSEVNLEGILYQANQVLEADADIVAQLEESGFLDTSKASIDYCKKELGAATIKHATPIVEMSVDVEAMPTSLTSRIKSLINN